MRIFTLAVFSKILHFDSKLLKISYLLNVSGGNLLLSRRRDNCDLLSFDFHIGQIFKYFILYYKTLHDIRFEQNFHILIITFVPLGSRIRKLITYVINLLVYSLRVNRNFYVWKPDAPQKATTVTRTFIASPFFCSNPDSYFYDNNYCRIYYKNYFTIMVAAESAG